MSESETVSRERKPMDTHWRGTWGRRLLWAFVLASQFGAYYHNLQVHDYIFPMSGAETVPAALAWSLIIIELGWFFGVTDSVGSWFYGWFDPLICRIRGTHLWRQVLVDCEGVVKQSRVEVCMTCGNARFPQINSSSSTEPIQYLITDSDQ